jgi:hypothetical protein
MSSDDDFKYTKNETVCAYLMDDNIGDDTNGIYFPIFGSVKYDGNGIRENSDRHYILLPGYEIKIYSSNDMSGTPIHTLKNETDLPKNYYLKTNYNKGRSCKIFRTSDGSEVLTYYT